MQLSLVIPCYNEEGNVRAFYDAAVAAFENRPFSYELIFIDDGSRDGTMRELEALYAMDAALKAAEVRLCKLYAPPSETNFGGGLLTGTHSACDAACAAFAAAVTEVAAQPMERM